MRLFAGTQFDRPPVCERCGRLETDCDCLPVPAPKNLIPAGKQTARLSVEKRRKGKVVTLIQGLPAIGNELPSLLARFKSACGAGGTLDGETLEIQGDHRDRLRELLEAAGYRVRG
jgi:translation initiation factor 1